VLNPWNLEGLKVAEQESGKCINNILQLRLHPEILRLKQRVLADQSGQMHQVDLQYFTARGPWYQASWKGDESRSGGIITNIGVHLFDMLLWIFGPWQSSELSIRKEDKATGTLQLEGAVINWRLSIDRDDLPDHTKLESKSTYRHLTIDGLSISLDDQFSALHQASYREILAGSGFSIADIEPTIDLVYYLRNQTLS
jgi:UDP-N-acetyl-2-amino-2-deoxyglucuronate dehydrogenase